MHYDFYKLNEHLKERLDSGQPFSCLRLDNTIGYVLDCLSRGNRPLEQFYNETALMEGGVFPNHMAYAYNVVIPSTMGAMKSCDILGFVDLSGEIKRNELFLSQFGDKPMFFGQDDIMIMDPGGLLNVAGNRQDIIPWTSHLKGKKVLVVSTHAESIKTQWNKIDKIWGENRDKIAPFELVDVIRSPYHPRMDNRQYSGCETWDQTVMKIIEQINSYDYDVLISGSSTSGPLYAEHAKRMGKVGIQTGGVHQLWFGVIGYRWAPEAHNLYAPWAKMYNEHWIYPLKEDEPANKGDFEYLETNYAYWKR